MQFIEPPAVGVSVVICTYTAERRVTLLESIQSLRAQTTPPCEVIVAVDHEPDLLQWLRREVTDVIAVANEQRHGLAATRNSGAWAASGDVVAFLDDDALAAPDWIERLSQAYRDPHVVGVGGAVLADFERGRPPWLPEEFDWVVGCTYRGLPTSPAPVRNLIGCNMSFRLDALRRAGGFVPGLGRVAADRTGCEETELCIRLTSRDPQAVVLYDPGARVCHKVPGARSNLGYFVARCYAEGLSKAAVARRCGATMALRSERAYARRTLPAGIRDGLVAFRRGEAAGLARALAIALGLVVTASGFAAAPRSRTAAS